MTHTLILADDLSGAADCASACLCASLSPLVLIDQVVHAKADVVAVDLDSRAKTPQEAGFAIAKAVERRLSPEIRVLYQKMDSTLRGNWARETAWALQAVATVRGQRPLAIVAPALPAAGRTVVRGRVRLGEVALEETETWAREGLTRPAEPKAWLEHEGLKVALAGIDKVWSGSGHLAAFVVARGMAGADAIVCDARTDADLDTIAAAVRTLTPMPLCVGSAGLMGALARLRTHAPAGSGPHPVVSAEPVLILVGSASQVSRRQVRALVEERAIATVALAPSALRRGARSGGLRAYANQIESALASRRDLIVTVDASEGVDLQHGQEYSAALADLVAPRLDRVGALIATGGETARALLTGSGVAGLRIHREVEPGVPLSSAIGALEIPVITKAGAFGDAMTLIRCLDALRDHSFSP